MQGYTVPMALFDYLPVLLSAFGLWQIRALVLSRNPRLSALMTLGICLAVGGGLCKATWKLIYAASGTDIAPLNAALFLGLAPGFVILCRGWFTMASNASGAMQLGQAVSIALALWSAALLLATGWPDTRYWFIALLTLMTIANTVLVVALAMTAWRAQLRVASALFAVNLCMAFILSGLGRIEEQTAALQWIEESLNFVAQGGFAWAALQLRRHATG